MLNLAKFCFQKPKTLPTTLILGERGFFTEKQIFYFVSTVLSKIVVSRQHIFAYNVLETLKASKFTN